MVALGSPLVSLNLQKSLIRDRIRAVTSGQATGIYLHGRPGSSKTYLVKTTLEDLGQRHAYANGHLTPIGLFDLLEQNPDSVIVLDDVSMIFKQSNALQILLAALGNPHDGSRTRTVRHKTATSNRVVYFSGSIIAISNLQLGAHKSAVLEALQDRVHVMAFEPTDEEIEAAIFDIIGKSPKGIPAKEAIEVARFLLEQCRDNGVRPSIRLFVDKALADYRLCKSGNSESHWKDLIRSSVRQLIVPQQHKLRDMTRRDQMAAERNIVLEIASAFQDPKDRLDAWKERTGKGKSAFYRRLREVQREGMLPDGDAAASGGRARVEIA